LGEVLRELEIKGRLFCHVGDALRPPPCAAPGRALQRWMRLHEVGRYLHGARDYRLLERRDWLAPATAGSAGRPFPMDVAAAGDCADSATQRDLQHPVQVAVMRAGGESERVFVTPDDWPASGLQ